MCKWLIISVKVYMAILEKKRRELPYIAIVRI